jgi:hypothetical protein
LPPPPGGGKAIRTGFFSNMIALTLTPLFAAAGYSLIYLLGGGGLFGAIVIFFAAKLLRK